MFRVTQDTTKLQLASITGLSPSMAELSRTFFSQVSCYSVVLQPHNCVATTVVWALPRSLATTGGIINLFSLPAGTKMFQFPAFASALQMKGSLPPGCPIRKSAGQCVFATRRSFSQLVTSFFASESQGIPHAPFVVPLFLYTSRLRHVVSPFGLLVCETLLCFYSCLLAISSAP